MALEAVVNRNGVYRVVLEEYPEVYVLVYRTRESRDDSPDEDHLQNDWPMARLAAQLDYDIGDADRKGIPGTRFNG